MEPEDAIECARDGNVYGLKRLLNLGGDPDEVDFEGRTALHYATDRGGLKQS